MDKLLQQISEIGVVPVIKLGHPTRDANAASQRLCARAAYRSQRLRSAQQALPMPSAS